MGETAKVYGITLCMEVLNRFENYLINTACEGKKFVEEINMDNVKLMLDTFHMNIEEVSMGEALEDIRYHGAAVMEPFVQMGGTVGKDIKIWRNMYNCVTEEMLDLDAREALTFQRYMLDYD